MTLTSVQNSVLSIIGVQGALTSRRVIADYGPRPLWHPLLTQGLLREYQTIYGPVVGLTDAGRQHQQHLNCPYIASPSTAADRAYLNDALSVVVGADYEIEAHDYQQAGGKRRHQLLAAGQPPTTSVIIRTTLRVPERVADNIYRDTHQRVERLHYIGGSYAPAQLGYPYLYASIRGGGINLSALKRLYKRHSLDTATWHHPLLLAVPDLQVLQLYIRSLEVNRWPMKSQRPWPVGFPPVRLIHLPLPRRR
ncbi:hypothetical protein ACI3L1_07710 [Deinococcus sp. SM5_A1]|uniref:hypothetical protein n=1 Tax=Deinococcus sp. SM5_A1 TaxID=3379094 RepID=UPI00385B041B